MPKVLIFSIRFIDLRVRGFTNSGLPQPTHTVRQWEGTR